MVSVRKVQWLGGHRLRVWFSDGAVGEWDHSDILNAAGPIALPLHDPAYFGRVFLEMGALTWPNGYDVCPEHLHGLLRDAGALKSAGVAAE